MPNYTSSNNSQVEVDISFLGNLKLAPYLPEYQQACEQVKAAFQSSPVTLPITLHENYREIRWLKLGWNIPFGALSLIFDQPTNVLAGQEPYQSLVFQLMGEVRKVAKADNVDIPEAMMQQWVQFTKESGPYMPTIYRDFHAGNPIEKAYLFDHVLTIAEQKNCNVPLLTLIQRHLSTLLASRTCA